MARHRPRIGDRASPAGSAEADRDAQLAGAQGLLAAALDDPGRRRSRHRLLQGSQSPAIGDDEDELHRAPVAPRLMQRCWRSASRTTGTALPGHSREGGATVRAESRDGRSEVGTGTGGADPAILAAENPIAHPHVHPVSGMRMLDRPPHG